MRSGVTRLILFSGAATGPEHANELELACYADSGWQLFELSARSEDARSRLAKVAPDPG
jgi:hypothetical protein